MDIVGLCLSPLCDCIIVKYDCMISSLIWLYCRYIVVVLVLFVVSVCLYVCQYCCGVCPPLSPCCPPSQSRLCCCDLDVVDLELIVVVLDQYCRIVCTIL